MVERWGDGLDSFIPSAILEQEAHRLGLGESMLTFSAIGSPQHLQIRGFMAIAVCQCQCLGSKHRSASA